MKSLINFTKGLEIINPFLNEHSFHFDKYEKGSDSSGEYIKGSFRNQQKKFLIDYRFSIGQILYQYENSIISHTYYLDQLGFKNKKLHTGFLSEDKPEEFNNILHDFYFLVDDFFKGECKKLKEFSKLEDNIIFELDKEIRLKNNIQNDKIRIEKAREQFRTKEFKKSIDIYNLVENRNLLSDLDENIIEFGKRHYDDK
jgi:hypothetical protein